MYMVMGRHKIHEAPNCAILQKYRFTMYNIIGPFTKFDKTRLPLKIRKNYIPS